MIEQILPISDNCRVGTKRTIKWIVIHETGNTSQGANAKAHANYLANVTKAKSPYVSWHYTVDDKEIYQHIPDDEIAWHAGDWRTNGINGGCGAGIGIELCVNSDGDFNKTKQNACILVAQLMKKHNLGANVGGIVRQHWEFSKKNCPQTIRATNTWQDFLNNCQAELEKLNAPIKPIEPVTDFKALYEEQLQANTNIKAEFASLNTEIILLRKRLAILNSAIDVFKASINQ